MQVSDSFPFIFPSVSPNSQKAPSNADKDPSSMSKNTSVKLQTNIPQKAGAHGRDVQGLGNGESHSPEKKNGFELCKKIIASDGKERKIYKCGVVAARELRNGVPKKDVHASGNGSQGTTHCVSMNVTLIHPRLDVSQTEISPPAIPNEFENTSSAILTSHEDPIRRRKTPLVIPKDPDSDCFLAVTPVSSSARKEGKNVTRSNAEHNTHIPTLSTDQRGELNRSSGNLSLNSPDLLQKSESGSDSIRVTDCPPQKSKRKKLDQCSKWSGLLYWLKGTLYLESEDVQNESKSAARICRRWLGVLLLLPLIFLGLHNLLCRLTSQHIGMSICNGVLWLRRHLQY